MPHINLITIPALLFLLTACTALHSNDPDELAFSIPPGSVLTLNKAISYGPSVTHAVIQHGKLISDQERQFYEISCRLDFKTFGPRSIQPESFTVTRTEDGSNWISQPAILRFYTEVYLSSSKGTDILKMVCQQYGDGIDRHFTVAEMQATLTELLEFQYATSSD